MSASPDKLHLIYGQEKSRQGSRCWLQNKFWKNVGWSQKSTSIAATLECLQSKWLRNPFSRKAASALAGFWYFANLPNFGAKAWFTGVQYTQYKVRFGKHKLLSLSIQSHYEIQSHYVIVTSYIASGCPRRSICKSESYRHTMLYVNGVLELELVLFAGK